MLTKQHSWQKNHSQTCQHCDAIARPNILMFGDTDWIEDNTEAQMDRFHSWVANIPRGDIAVIEIGAGKAVPTVRRYAEYLVQQKYAKLIRINPREWDGFEVTVPIPAGGLETLQAIDEQL